jgi:hypothetical protein
VQRLSKINHAIHITAPNSCTQDNNVELSIDKVRSEMEDYALRAYTMVRFAA